MAEDTNGEHANDDDDRGDLLLEEPAAQQRDGHGSKAGDQLVEVGLERGDLVDAQAGGAKLYWDSALWMASATPWPPPLAVSAMAFQSM